MPKPSQITDHPVGRNVADSARLRRGLLRRLRFATVLHDALRAGEEDYRQ